MHVFTYRCVGGINFVLLLETRTIAQMKSILILIKSYKRHICQKWIFDPLLSPQRQKLTRKSQNWPYLKSLLKKYTCHILAILLSCKVVFYLNNHQVWLMYIYNWRIYAKPANSVQNMLFLYSFLTSPSFFY